MGYYDKRIIFSNSINDIDVLNYLIAANITALLERNAANYLITSLKLNNLWSKMYALYPFLGSVASSHKYNAVNPLDTNGAFRMTFSSTTHSYSGVSFNATSAYGRTYLTPSTTMSLGSQSAGANFSGIIGSSGVYFGATLGTGYFILQLGATFTVDINCASGNLYAATYSNKNGFKAISRTTTSNCSILTDGSTTTFTQTEGVLSGREMFLGCRNNGSPTNYIDGTCKFHYISSGLTTSELAILKTIENNFQTILGR